MLYQIKAQVFLEDGTLLAERDMYTDDEPDAEAIAISVWLNVNQGLSEPKVIRRRELTAFHWRFVIKSNYRFTDNWSKPENPETLKGNVLTVVELRIHARLTL